MNEVKLTPSSFSASRSSEARTGSASLDQRNKRGNSSHPGLPLVLSEHEATSVGLSLIPVSASERQTAPPSIGLYQKRLIDVIGSNVKGVSGSGHEEPPHAVRRLIRQPYSLVVMRFQPANPVTQRQHVVLTETFDVTGFKSLIFCNPRADINGCGIPVRENIGL